MYRNKKLLALAKDKCCANCGTQDGTVVSAHSNMLQHGKGRGIKANDWAIAWLCFKCHTLYDQGTSMNRREKEVFFLNAALNTYGMMLEQGMLEVK